MKKIYFFKDEVKFRLNKVERLKKWIMMIVKSRGFKVENINFIFCSDKSLRKINRQYLKHDYYTDIITFDNSMEKEMITGDIYISIDRIRENAVTFNTTFNEELRRVMSHGVLHLIGYNDKNIKQRREMRRLENYWLNKF